MIESKTVHVFFASDERYLPYLSVALTSLSAHAADEYIYDIKILSEDFSNAALEATRDALKDNIKISVYDIKERLSHVKGHLRLRLRDYYSESIYYRMFIPSMFEDLKRAVYLDSDIVLLDDVAKLYFTDIGDKLLGAVTDESVIGVSVFCDYVKRQIGVEDPSEYFNSGVLLMNLDGMREAGIEKTFLDLLRTHNFNTVAPDQDYLNLLCRGRVHYLSSGWNKHAIPGTDIASEQLHLIHFNMFNKPWHYDGVPYEEVFWRFAKMSSYAELIEKGKAAYTEDERRRDAEGAEGLLLMARQIYESGDSMNEILCGTANSALTQPVR